MIVKPIYVFEANAYNIVRRESDFVRFMRNVAKKKYKIEKIK